MKRFPTTTRLLTVLLLLLSGMQVAWSQTSVKLTGESRLWIDGTSSVNSFTCVVGTMQGAGYFNGKQSSGRDVAAEVVVPVRQFDCGKARMNQDFYDALKAQSYPQIRFTLAKAEKMTSRNEAGHYSLRVSGRLMIAGTERPVTLMVEGQQNADGTYRATGHLPLLMSDFGIVPPTALLGLVKAHDRITVRFDLIASAQPTLYTN